MKCFTVLPNGRILEGIRASVDGFFLLDDSEDIHRFSPVQLKEKVPPGHFPPPEMVDGRVFEVERMGLSTLADLDHESVVFCRANGGDDKKALVVWRLPPKSALFPPDNTTQDDMRKRGIVAKPSEKSFSIVLAVIGTEGGFAGMLLMEEHTVHMAQVGAGGPFAAFGLGGRGASIVWDGVTLTLPAARTT